MSLKNRVTKQIGKKEQIEHNYNQKQKELVTLEKLKITIQETQTLLQVTAQETQGAFKVHLEAIVQTALSTCFPGKYKFCLDFILKSGSTVCDIYLENRNGCRVDPKDAAGGGVVDIISIALRLAVWTLTKPDNVLVLDEPFKWLSAELRPLGGEILQTLSKKLNMQIIMVTHDTLMNEIADKIFKVTISRKGISHVHVMEVV